jgi:hypothetical protein
VASVAKNGGGGGLHDGGLVMRLAGRSAEDACSRHGGFPVDDDGQPRSWPCLILSWSTQCVSGTGKTKK